MPSLSVTVTVPSSPTVTFASAGKSGFAFLTASSTAFFSSSVNLDGSFTSVFSGAFSESSFSIVSSGPNLAVFVVSPSFTVTVTLPLSSTVIWSSVKLGLTAFTASFTACCSSGVSFSKFLTLTLLGLFNVNFVASSTTVSFWDRAPVLPPSVTITEPSSATSIFAVSGRSGFAFLTASLTFSFSASVNSLMFCTGVFSGAFNAILLSVSSSFLTVLAGAIVWSPAVPIGTVTVPSSATLISSSLKSRSGLAALTASLTLIFS